MGQRLLAARSSLLALAAALVAALVIAASPASAASNFRVSCGASTVTAAWSGGGVKTVNFAWSKDPSSFMSDTIAPPTTHGSATDNLPLGVDGSWTLTVTAYGGNTSAAGGKVLATLVQPSCT